jgi:hypothetical protein
VEPVHNVGLLAAGELGLAGGLLCLLAGFLLLSELRRALRLEAIALSAAVAALLVLGVFDHYLWSLAPGRALAGMILGVWAGQVGLYRQSGMVDEIASPHEGEKQNSG